jgi:tetratricopeptide (TPR) repeat protein
VDTKIDNNLKARQFKIKDRIDKLTVAASAETDKGKKARLLHELGALNKDIQNHDKANSHLDEAAALETEINSVGIGLAKVLTTQAEVASLAGNNERSADLYEKSLAILRKSAGTTGATSDVLAKTIQAYAKVLYKVNKVDKANELYAELKTLQASGSH